MMDDNGCFSDQLRDWIHMEYSMYWDCWLDVDIPVD